MPHWVEKLVDAIVTALVALFTPLVTILGSTTLLVICDLITGVLKAKKQGEEVTSHGIKKTAVKLGVYLIVIVLSSVTETYLTNGQVPVLNVVTSIIGITELKSCVENLNIITGGTIVDTIMRAISQRNPANKFKKPEDK